MRINPVTINNLNFTSTSRTKYKNIGTDEEYIKPYYSAYEDYIAFMEGRNPAYSVVKIVNSNQTSFFRDDINDWLVYAKRIDEAFKGADKVNVYDFGCSDGSEPYTLAISLIEALGEEGAEKYFPIKAMDKDPFIIYSAKKGEICCTKKDFERINQNTGYKFDKYFEILHNKQNGDKIISPKEILRSKVEFSRKNATEGLSEVEPENSLVLTRNFLPYLSEDELKEAVIQMRKLKDSSRILIGDFDHEYSDGRVPWFLIHNGILEDGLFLKTDSKQISKRSDDDIRSDKYFGYSDD